MSFQFVCRLSLAVLFSAIIAGCASTAPRDECRWDRSRCMHEGSYEPGEREYAEQEAKELNRAAAKKLRRRSGWWW